MPFAYVLNQNQNCLIGKTRFGKELFSVLKDNWIDPYYTDLQPLRWRKDNIRFHYIYMDFGDGIQLQEMDNDISDPSIIIGLRIAYCYFVKGSKRMSFDTFRILVKAHNDLFRIGSVFDAIKQDLSHGSNHQLFLFLHIDEFQIVDQWDEANRKQGKPDISLFKNMINSFAPFMMPSSSIFVQTFLSGTVPRLIISAKETSMISFGFVRCPLLSFRAMFEIAEYFSKEFDAEIFKNGTYKWTLNQRFLQLLEDTGGLPRAMELLFQECFRLGQDVGQCEAGFFFKNIGNWNFDSLSANIKSGLLNRYKLYESISINKELILALLRYSLSGKRVLRSMLIVPSDKHLAIGNLEYDSHIILDPVNGSPAEFTIRMPFFFICLYNDILRVVDCTLDDTFRIHCDMKWQDWEHFVAHFEAFRNNLLIELGTQETTLSELYCNVKGTEATLNTVVRLQKLSVSCAREQFPSIKLTDKEGRHIDWEKGESVIVNGGSASWGDAFIVRQNQTEKFIFIHQDKHDYNSVEFTAKELDQEHSKNISGSHGAKEDVRRKLATFQHITIVFTTQPFNDQIAVDGCLVVSRDNFKDYFGPIFSSRATFALTKAINPNFSKLDRMIACLDGVGDVTGTEIVENRPYKNQEDFFTKIPRAKRGIEKYETENPGKKIKLEFYPFQ